MKILLMEDDFVLAREISIFLNSNNISCDVVYDGELFFHKLNTTNDYSMYVLDVNVPKINGFNVCKEIRKSNLNIPILMLTAFSDIDDKLLAFTNGADDYLVKPFHFDELLVRIKALGRRIEKPQEPNSVIKLSDLLIDLDTKEVKRGDKVISLTPKEFKLLTILAEANGRVLSKQFIADKLWDYHIETNQNTIEVYVNFLRNKIDKDFSKKLIQTKIGFGYYINKE